MNTSEFLDPKNYYLLRKRTGKSCDLSGFEPDFEEDLGQGEYSAHSMGYRIKGFDAWASTTKKSQKVITGPHEKTSDYSNFFRESISAHFTVISPAGGLSVRAAVSHEGFLIPEEFKHLTALIDSSKALLELEDDWDEQGSARYEERVWRRAWQIVIRTLNGAYEATLNVLDPPNMLPGPAGSIDVLWESGDLQLLVNVPLESKMIGFYGKRGNVKEVRGTATEDVANGLLLAWLTS